MSKYRISAVKSVSPLKRYGFMREIGVGMLDRKGEPVILKGQALDDFIDEAIWRKNHPGQEPIKEWEDGVSAK